VLTIGDIPDDLRLGASDGENIGRLASGVGSELEEAFGSDGAEAGLRLVHASFRFRSSDIGREMVRSARALTDTLSETPQLVEYAGLTLGATMLASAIDMCAAALHRVEFKPPFKDPRRDVDLDWFFSDRGAERRGELREVFQGWLQNVKGSPWWEELQGVRHHLLHRWVQVNVTIGASAAQELVINKSRYSAPEFDASRAFVVDRFVAAGLLLREAALTQ
jgi:hypothetical protein